MGNSCCAEDGLGAVHAAFIADVSPNMEERLVVSPDVAAPSVKETRGSPCVASDDSSRKEPALLSGAALALNDADTDVEDSELHLQDGCKAQLKGRLLRSDTGVSGQLSDLTGDTCSNAEVDDSLPCSATSSHGGLRGSHSLRCGAGRNRLRLHTRDELISDIKTHLDMTHDVLAAEELVGELKSRMSREEWAEFQDEEVMKCFRSRLEQFYGIGTSCCLETDEWFVAFVDRQRGAKLECMFASSEPKVWYRLHIALPASMPRAAAISCELHLLPSWNPGLSKTPVRVGEHSAFSAVIGYSSSWYGGLYKVDILSEVQRFVDSEAGFMAEATTPVAEGHSSYIPPAKGHARLDSSFKRLWIAVGSSETVVIQAGSVELPFAANRSLISLMAQTTGRRMFSRIRQAAARAMKPGSPWEPAIEADSQGLYEVLGRCASSEGSRQRAVASVANGDLGSAMAASLRPEDMSDMFSQRPGCLLRRRTTPADDPPADAPPADASPASPTRPSFKKSVSFGPTTEIRTIPDRAGHTEEYRFLAEQHNRLNDALALTARHMFQEDSASDPRAEGAEVALRPCRWHRFPDE